MKRRLYVNTGIPASRLHVIRDYLNQTNSESLGNAWEHRVHWYELVYPEGPQRVGSFDEVAKMIRQRGETTKHSTYFESRTGRKLRLDTTNPSGIELEIENGRLTDAMMKRVEEIMGLSAHPRRVFLTHGQSHLWHEVANFIEREATPRLPILELASRPNQGRTLIEKLEQEAGHCSYAVVVMTGDDVAEDEVRARENVIHEIGYFQGRYGRGRVCLLHEDGVNVPSNLSGLAYCPFPKARVTAAFIELQRDLRAAFADAD